MALAQVRGAMLKFVALALLACQALAVDWKLRASVDPGFPDFTLGELILPWETVGISVARISATDGRYIGIPGCYFVQISL